MRASESSLRHFCTISCARFLIWMNSGVLLGTRDVIDYRQEIVSTLPTPARFPIISRPPRLCSFVASTLPRASPRGWACHLGPTRGTSPATGHTVRPGDEARASARCISPHSNLTTPPASPAPAHSRPVRSATSFVTSGASTRATAPSFLRKCSSASASPRCWR